MHPQFSGWILFSPPPPPTYVPYFCMMVYYVMTRALYRGGGGRNVLWGGDKDLIFLTLKTKFWFKSVASVVGTSWVSIDCLGTIMDYHPQITWMQWQISQVEINISIWSRFLIIWTQLQIPGWGQRPNVKTSSVHSTHGAGGVRLKLSCPEKMIFSMAAQPEIHNSKVMTNWCNHTRWYIIESKNY